ncbi:cobalt ECF transporter T component CbiQ [Vibrio sp. JC009]|uniref:cobalt ECF transporter T component CbiQ n=1 Tax=Vibrio sp. JC009 TaxID=2912314 RepID=UPI0023AED73A|nr:cobalt ECF transporter T component CbiQ [Vibrio sp. JC009]WED24664.1 cobalt ECF transporter T component CbiQ [Vibrio sp. JC009]
MEAILAGREGAGRSDSIPAHSRIIVAIAAIFAVVLSDSLLACFCYFLLALFLWKQSPMGLGTGLKRLMMIDGLIILTILPLPFSYVGDQFVQFGPLSLSEPGLFKAAEVFIKATLSAMIMMGQFSGTSELELSKALFTLRVPTRFILLLQFSIRYISVMQQELSRLRVAMRARGFGGGPTLHNWKSYGYLFGMLFVKALDRADRIWLAMKCRGYRGYFPVTSGVREVNILNKPALFYLLIVAVIFVADLTNILPGYRLTMD